MNTDLDSREMADWIQGCDPLPSPKSAPLDGASRLLRLADLAEELRAEPVAEEARELAVRVAEGCFYVTCVGQFKRGKSTQLNALIWSDPVNLCTAVGGFLFFEGRASNSRGRVGDD
jgi:hypothetical protein